MFYGAKFLQEVNFAGKKLTEIPVDCFRSTTELKKIVIPEGVEAIGERAFDGSGITEVTLPTTLKTIGPSAFIDCPIESVKLPKKLTSIDESAFRNTKLSKIDLPDGIQEIGQSAFESTGIKKFTLPDDFEIKKDFVFDKTVTMVVKKNSKAHKALEEFMNHYSSDFWTVEYKK